mgnify:CR=1 FL=1
MTEQTKKVALPAYLPKRLEAFKIVKNDQPSYLLRDKLLNPILLTTLVILALVVLVGWAAARWALAPQYRRLAHERTGRMAQALAQSAAVRQRMDDCLARLDESERLE